MLRIGASGKPLGSTARDALFGGGAVAAGATFWESLGAFLSSTGAHIAGGVGAGLLAFNWDLLGQIVNADNNNLDDFSGSLPLMQDGSVYKNAPISTEAYQAKMAAFLYSKSVDV